jgi:hypothetical protein
MDEQAEKLAAEPVPAHETVPRPNSGRFRPGKNWRGNRQGRPRGSKAVPAGTDPADCAPDADRLMYLSLPASELAWRLKQANGFWLLDMPKDVVIVGSRVDPEVDRFVIVIRSQTFPRIAKGALIPEFVPQFRGLQWRKDKTWCPHDR